ncbi:Uncharacterized protein dnm_024370 [Desulfonema magnum]|uniref:Uncharacterized protein n=1 Tax=Desulfonema magnum TaxID=45655 RepID=A0A975GN17_9BACT|nr:Uncharacterized protein dnm_024370 [Desulfonema magnum]
MSRPGISGKSLNPMSYSRASPESVIIRTFATGISYKKGIHKKRIESLSYPPLR